MLDLNYECISFLCILKQKCYFKISVPYILLILKVDTKLPQKLPLDFNQDNN